MSMESFRPNGSSYVEWSAVIAGAVLASAISIVLLQFGSAIGLAATSPFDPMRQLTAGGVIAVGLWTLWIQVTASFAGGYLAGRLRAPVSVTADHEREVRDGMHGLLVWATGTVAVVIAVSAASALHAVVETQTNGQVDLTPDVVTIRRNTAIIMAFVAASVSLVSAVASWWAATMGGEHRDRNADHSRYISFRRL